MSFGICKMFPTKSLLANLIFNICMNRIWLYIKPNQPNLNTKAILVETVTVVVLFNPLLVE